MSHYETTRVGLLSKKTGIEQLTELLECMGAYDIYRPCSENTHIIDDSCQEPILDFEPDIVGSCEMDAGMVATVFYLANKIYKDVFVYWFHDESHDTVDSYVREELLYNPDKKKLYKGERDYCLGDGTAFEDTIFEIFQDRIEEEANKRGIEIDWECDPYFLPNYENEEFSELCEEMTGDYSLEELGERKMDEDLDIDMLEIDIDYIKGLIRSAEEKGYAKLSEEMGELVNS